MLLCLLAHFWFVSRDRLVYVICTPVRGAQVGNKYNRKHYRGCQQHANTSIAAAGGNPTASTWYQTSLFNMAQTKKN